MTLKKFSIGSKVKKMAGNFFSDKFINKEAVKDNILLLCIYRFSYPFAYLMSRIGFSPNGITTLSLISSILAFLVLGFGSGSTLFIFFWGIAILFDFCDGTVARMNGRVSKISFRYDHMSDLLKIALVIFGIGFRYELALVWAIAYISMFLFLYGDLLNYQYDARSRKSGPGNNEVLLEESQNKNNPKRMREKSRVAAWIVRRPYFLNFLINLFSAIFTINGHTLFIFFVAPFGEIFASAALLYFCVLSLRSIRFNITYLISHPRISV